MHKISVIIPTLNEANYINNLLHDLKNQSVRPFEIIVVDGKSSDSTQQLVKKSSNVILLTTKPNPAKQRTLGGDKATGELLIFLDADVRINKHFLLKIEKQFRTKNFSIGCPYYLPYHSTLAITAVYLFFNCMFFLFQKFSPSGAGSCIVVTKTAYQKSNGFNSSLTYDDIEFIRRVSRKNRFAMLPAIVNVSDRRFRTEGFFLTSLRYFILSFFFMTNYFGLANHIPYKFNHYKH